VRVDSGGQTRGASAAQDARSHENGDSDWGNAPASRHADEIGADDNRDDDAEKNRPARRAEHVKKRKADGAADESVDDAGVERQKRGAEFRFRDDDDGDERPKRIGVIDAIENKPHDDATDQNSHGILNTGRLGNCRNGSLGNGGHGVPRSALVFCRRTQP